MIYIRSAIYAGIVAQLIAGAICGVVHSVVVGVWAALRPVADVSVSSYVTHLSAMEMFGLSLAMGLTKGLAYLFIMFVVMIGPFAILVAMWQTRRTLQGARANVPVREIRRQLVWTGALPGVGAFVVQSIRLLPAQSLAGLHPTYFLLNALSGLWTSRILIGRVYKRAISHA